MRQFLKDGHVVMTPLDGIDYDLKQLSAAQVHELNRLVNKQRTGSMFTSKDAEELIELRKAARRTQKADPHDKLRESIRDLKAVLR